jgi:glycosyltransferase involved in cell wall biosynthesis
VEGFDFLIPGDPDTPTGGYVYDRRLAQGMRALGWRVRIHELDASFPFPSGAALSHAESVLEEIPPRGLVLVDGLAMGAMPNVVATQSRRLRLVALVHHPLAEETGLPSDCAEALRSSERQALAAAARIVVTSRHTAGLVAAMGVPAGLLHVVTPGTDPAPLARGSGNPVLDLLCVATITQRKGHATLMEALADLTALDWRLTCVGSTAMDPATVARLRDQITRLGLEDRVRVAGEVDRAELDKLYHRADLFVLATRFEGYGMALTEAIARGLPVVSTRTGAVPETLPPEAAVLVPPGDPAALSTALRQVISDRLLRGRLARGARKARGQLKGWRTACLFMEQALRAAQ